ncbi:MAG: type II 3-dehydroquinate dehydratase [Spirochaetales bacterium]|nr:type II 3-dehydroquinate dehydratase [Spirochaetales bacterium]
MNVLLLQGPNLNLLGRREPHIYGTDTQQSIHDRLCRLAEDLGARLTTFQSNHEGELIDRIQSAPTEFQGILINAGALTHTSLALADALTSVALPFVEIHISNVYARESFRHHSHLSAGAAGIVVGFGTTGYDLALQGLLGRIRGQGA